MSNPYDIVIVPDPVLKTTAKAVAAVDDEVRRQMDRMLETMYRATGIGLAANQVGILNRVLVMDVEQREGRPERKPVFMANPEIVWKSEELSILEEGCLSIPGQFAEIERPVSVRVRYQDYEGRQKEVLAERMLARCVQHEIDHLNGILFVDYLSNLKRNMMIRRVEKMKKQDEIL